MAVPFTFDEMTECLIAQRMLEGDSCTQIAAELNVSDDTILKVFKRRKEQVQSIIDWKERESKVSGEMQKHRKKISKALELCLDAMCEQERIKKATLSQLGTVIGILFDKLVTCDRLAERDDLENESVTIVIGGGVNNENDYAIR